MRDTNNKAIMIKPRTILILFLFFLNPLASLAQSKDNMKPYTGPFILKGSSRDAQLHSLNYSTIALHISGGEKDEKYTALQYAKMLEAIFKDTAYTQYPIQITIYYEESGLDRATALSVKMNGLSFDKNGGRFIRGDGVYHPYALVKDIAFITKHFAEKGKDAGRWEN